MIEGQVYDPFVEFMIIPNGEFNGQNQGYMIIDSAPEFISKNVLSMIYEIGNLKHTLNGLSRTSTLCFQIKDWENLVNESLLNFPQILISDSFKVQIIVEEIHQNLSQSISSFLRLNGVSRTLSILRASFLGGRGDLIMSLHESFKFLRLEEVGGTFYNSSIRYFCNT